MRCHHDGKCFMLLLLSLQVASIPDRHWLTPAWMHDFACTDKYR